MKNTPYTTLFLDRDGVLNRHRPDDYVKNTGELEILPGVPEALKMLAPCFGHIFIVTNQRGVGKGLMTYAALQAVHARLLEEIARAGGRIDRIYCCTETNDSSPDRKPNTGMAFQAQRDYPEISLTRSLMIGDSASDMLFARRAGMHAVWIDSKSGKETINPDLYDERYPDLYTFACDYLMQQQK
ncbi:MAG: HAD family hydrolase [Parabacteroides sp.]|nr:HAD family hydrolase [Parabacteroides sp.]